MQTIEINDSEAFEIRSLRVIPSDDFKKIKVVLRIKKRGAPDETAVKFGGVIPYDVLDGGGIKEAELLPEWK